jgi:hypothetical protein
MAALRYAMDHSERLLSVTSSDTSSATIPLDKYCGPEWDERPVPMDDPDILSVAEYNTGMLAAFPNFAEMFRRLREDATHHPLAPFYNRFDSNADPERCWRWALEIQSLNNPVLCSAFARGYYADHDPRTAALRRIGCPNSGDRRRARRLHGEARRTARALHPAGGAGRDGRPRVT